jgi:hypothetical protein
MSVKGKRLIYVGPADGSVNKAPLTTEGIATEASILPGSVVHYAAASAGLELADDAATVFGKPLMVANKDEFNSASVDTAWTINETMIAIKPRSGEFLNVSVITAQALVVGTALTRLAGTPGSLTIAATDGTEEILCYADEVVTTAATQLVRVSIA